MNEEFKRIAKLRGMSIPRDEQNKRLIEEYNENQQLQTQGKPFGMVIDLSEYHLHRLDFLAVPATYGLRSIVLFCDPEEWKDENDDVRKQHIDLEIEGTKKIIRAIPGLRQAKFAAIHPFMDQTNIADYVLSNTYKTVRGSGDIIGIHFDLSPYGASQLKNVYHKVAETIPIEVYDYDKFIMAKDGDVAIYANPEYKDL